LTVAVVRSIRDDKTNTIRYLAKVHGVSRETIRRFSAMLRRCRAGANDSLLAAITSETCREVSISAPSGHDFVSVHFTRMALNYRDVHTVTTGRLPYYEPEH
jgi:hypothetical protein